MSRKAALFIGRWQPFHNGHAYIIQQALDAGKSVLIAVRDTPISPGDPYTVHDRVAMIKANFKDDPVEIIIIPDIESVNIGRKVGYDVIRYDVPEVIEGISATQIRAMMADDDDRWKGKVPHAIAEYLESMKRGMVIWFTGMSGAGKSTLAEMLADRLRSFGMGVKVLDGDEVRENLTAGLGFSKNDRDENIKRIGFVAKSVADAGGVAIVAAISPYDEARERIRSAVGADRFFLVYLKCDIDILIKRDTKGLYAKAIDGEIENFTGISDPYEAPVKKCHVFDTGKNSEDEVISFILTSLSARMKFPVVCPQPDL